MKILNIYWEDHKSPSASDLKILDYLYDNDDEVKRIFHNVVYQFASLKLRGGSILELSSNLEIDIWNSSSIAEKSFYKTPEILNFLKFLALDLFLKKHHSIKNLTINNCSKKEKKHIKYLAKKFDIEINFREVVSNSLNIRHFIPHIYQALVWLLLKGWSFKGLNSRINNDEKSNVLVYSTLAHLKKDPENDKKIISGLWGDLPKLFFNHRLSIRWIYDFTRGSLTKTPKESHDLLNSHDNDNFQTHSILVPINKRETFFKSLLFFTKYYLLFSFKLFNLKRNFSHNILLKSYYSYLKFNIKDSFFGICAIENILYSNTFDDILNSINKQDLGLFINENQGWEFLFIKSWKKFNHGKLISIQHSTVSYWDLRYYYREWINESLTPDFISVNGDVAKKSFLKSNYPSEKIIQLESLRYNYLSKFDKMSKINRSKNILVLGNILLFETLKMIKIVSEVLKNKGFNFVFKSHPANIINSKFLKNFSLTSRNLNELFGDFDTVICPASSGSSVEAFIVGLKTILYTDDEVNTSPLYGNPKAFNFSTTDELLCCLEKPNDLLNIQNFFYVDQDYKFWNQLLKKT